MALVNAAGVSIGITPGCRQRENYIGYAYYSNALHSDYYHWDAGRRRLHTPLVEKINLFKKETCLARSQRLRAADYRKKLSHEREACSFSCLYPFGK